MHNSDHIMHTIPRSWRQYKHTIPHLRCTLQFHARGNNTKHTILHSQKPHKAQFRSCGAHWISTLVETIQSTQFRTCGGHIKLYLRRTLHFHVCIQSTQFCACGGHIKHTIPCLWSTLQFHTRGDTLFCTYRCHI